MCSSKNVCRDSVCELSLTETVVIVLGYYLILLISSGGAIAIDKVYSYSA